jgi:hypothetical protein
VSRARAGRRHVLGVFAHADALTEALRRAKASPGLEVEDVYSPVPDHQVLELCEPRKSPVRLLTFAGGLTGLTGGLALAVLTSLVWNMIVFGKPVTSVVPFLVVGFEGTILFGALGTLVGLLLFARLPYTAFPPAAYRPSFSKDRFGLWLSCRPHRTEHAHSLLRETGAEQVEDIDLAEPPVERHVERHVERPTEPRGGAP